MSSLIRGLWGRSWPVWLEREGGDGVGWVAGEWRSIFLVDGDWGGDLRWSGSI
jgi:hypothetical protein